MLATYAVVLATVAAEPLSYTFSTKLDHFSSSNDTMFNIRYIMDDQYFTEKADIDPSVANYSQPILFYAGNEGDIWDFYDNTGFISELASMTGGMVVYAEHRYFGQSYPFAQDIALTSGYNQWLTVEQTMMDYIELIKDLKAKHSSIANQPVIAIGGSYGGMLAAYLRMKYPNYIQGALASSAPVLYFRNGTVADTAFDDKVT